MFKFGYLPISFFLLLPFVLQSQVAHGKENLPAAAIERVRQYKILIKEVEPKPVNTIVMELEKSDHPLLNLQIKEAMAKTYVDIVSQQHIEGAAKKQWLYSMIALNMAYLQFGGTKSNEPLNQLILEKLKNNLPTAVLDQIGSHYSLE